ncbi:TIGR04255 family protein [Pseudomonas nitroreducens]|nr:TIGR04255 family protein [Pseudomonas nitroreducens]NMZ58174.1 TIGR04255 family protein [Pseudomonas nitroreducens]SNS12485.1 TIGR04255 family protein [Pseudomonas nitroreducens]
MTSRTGILKNSPLAHVIASVRFAPWPLIAKHMADIQNALREIAPLMSEIQLEQLGPDGQPLGTPRQSWVLIAADHSFSIQFSSDQMLIHSYKYSRFSDFSERFDRSISTLLQHMGFIDVINMGVRYIDHIKPKNNEDIEQYINKKFLPATTSDHKSIGGQSVADYLISETTRLRVNILSMPGTPNLPQDVISVSMMDSAPYRQLQIEVLQENQLTLDMDAIFTPPTPSRIKREDILEKLKYLHDVNNAFFRHPEVCSEHAFKVWKGEQ